MEASLDGSYLRCARAGQHIGGLRRSLKQIQAKFVSDLDIGSMRQLEFIYPSKGTVDLVRPDWFPELVVPRWWSVRTGEVLYNLRSALDYLVFELALLDSGAPKSGTQFPIATDEAGLHTQLKKGYLRGLSQAHRVAICDLQPFAGHAWLTSFSRLSNPDRHRRLTTLAPDSTITKVDVDPSAGAESILVNVHMNFDVVFEDLSPVVPTLSLFRDRVKAVLDQFQTDFATRG